MYIKKGIWLLKDTNPEVSVSFLGDS